MTPTTPQEGAQAPEIRLFSRLEEYVACVDLQEEIWGAGFREQVSAAILMIANKMGGVAAGAFDEEDRLLGFVFGLTGVKDGGLAHWSDMLAVRPELRDLGLGTRLKAFQRELLLERGIGLMHWTFDPLQARNAYVNFAKLGITTREYVENMYGETASPLHRVGTDRLVARWEIDSPRVVARLAGEDPAPTLKALDARGDGVPLPRILSWDLQSDLPVPEAADLSLTGPRLLLTIPGEVDSVMATDLPLAIRWREATREPFLHYLARGYELRELVREGPVSHYLLERDEA
jgi:predicted GNAT superfamily acetyltransferase